jgi:hypothetical protein
MGQHFKKRPVKSMLPLAVRLPELVITIGIIFFVVAIQAKHLPKDLGSLPIIQLPCAFFSAVLIPFGSLLALRALFFQGTHRRRLLSYHLLGVLFGFGILSGYFYMFFIMNRVLDLPKEMPNILPKLVENARSFPSEHKRMLQAHWAYRLYGVIIAYRLDNEQVVYYQPTAEDLATRTAEDQSKRQVNMTEAFLKKILAQFPHLFALYAATYTATFTAGWIWLVLKMPKDSFTTAAS